MNPYPPSRCARTRRLCALPLAALLVAASPAAARACSIAPQFWVRNEALPGLVLQALPDTVYAGLFVPRREDERTGAWAPDSARAQRVYGQVFRVVEVAQAGAAPAPEVRPGGRIVLLRWGLGAGCQQEAPGRARQVAPGEVVFSAPRLRPRAAWAAGLPTFEVSAFDEHSYNPAHYRALGRGWTARLFRPGPLTAAEYARMYLAMPGRAAWLRDPAAATDRVRRWARANPGLTGRQPVRTMLQHLDYLAERMREEARDEQRRRASPRP